ncbi:MAG: 6-pyruvoyl-tetrahydropterin synthase-related protein [Candidatus Roizmanbacteria bacterium]
MHYMLTTKYNLIKVVKEHKFFFEILCLLIISIPAVFSLLNPYYFSMHDDQHIVRLFLLERGVRQGDWFPRWVDGLGFGYGYPLFNFYPPLIYYIGFIFRLIFGISLVSSMKSVIILGFFLASLGMYYFMRQFVSRTASFISAIVYTYYSYHAITAYVRGAFAEFFSLSILPFVFLTLYLVFKKPSIRNSLWFGLAIALLILTHPLIALPSIPFLCIFGILMITFSSEKIKSILYAKVGALLGLMLSAFFWIPSFIERQYTLVDKVFLGELSSYFLHFVCPQQFWYSPWGFGASIKGCYDGISFQIGKIFIFAIILSLITAVVYFKKNRLNTNVRMYLFFLVMSFFTYFLMTDGSVFVWNIFTYLRYLQFPWRLLTFASFFVSISIGFGFYFLNDFISKLEFKYSKIIPIIICICYISGVIIVQQKYFYPQNVRNVSDTELTSRYEIAWRVSRSSFEFVPKGVKTIKSDLGTTILDISPETIQKSPYSITWGRADVHIIQDDFNKKIFDLKSNEESQFQLNTFFFPGWEVDIYNKESKQFSEIPMNVFNDLHLMQIHLPRGDFQLRFEFKNGKLRSYSNFISILGVILYLILILVVFLSQVAGKYIHKK